MKTLNEIIKLEWDKDSSGFTLTDGEYTYGEIYSSSEKGCYNIEVTKYGERELQKDGYSLKRGKEELKKFHVKGINEAKKEAVILFNILYKEVAPEKASDVLTEMETEMFIEIMECETEGLGRGYSEYDGKGLTPSQKGVLSSLVQKEMVYDSYEDEGTKEKMFCTISNQTRNRIAEENNLK